MTELFATPSRLLWTMIQFSRRVWVRVTLMAVLALAAAGMAPVLQRLVPFELPGRIGSDSVRPILNILATSMLAVTTFSLSVMVAAHRAASDQVTPRTHRLLLADATTQTVLATFLGAFVYALATIILIDAGVFDDSTIAVSFLTTILVIVLVVLGILRWIGHLVELGSMLETTRRVENAAAEALAARAAEPWLGGRPADEAPDGLAHKVFSARIGYVEHVDTGALRDLAQEAGCDILLHALPGSFVAPDTALASLGAALDAEAVCRAFAISDARSFDQDPRFGLIVLSEIASRALSPGVNDPGTAIDVVGRLARLLCGWEVPGKASSEARLFVAALDPADLIEDAFAAIARDGAGNLEVQIRLQKALRTLAVHADEGLARAARAMAARAFGHAEAGLALKADLERLAAALPEGVPAGGYSAASM